MQILHTMQMLRINNLKHYLLFKFVFASTDFFILNLTTLRVTLNVQFFDINL